MSFSTVKLNSNVQQGQIVKYDSEQSKWILCIDNTEDLVGVVSDAPFQQNDENYGLVYFGGLVSAICVEQIPANGGFIGIRDGGVYVDSVNRYGVIQPIAFDQVVPNVGDLVSIHLK